MKRAWLRNAFLALAVAGLALFAYLKPGTDSPVEHALSTISPEAARSIRVERLRAQPIALEKRGEEWFLISPLAARADPVQMQRLLAIAGAKSPARLAATDLARFELDRPAARLTIDSQAFEFGIVSDVSREQYVLTGETVYAVSPVYGAALPANAWALVSKSVLARNEVPVRIQSSEFTVARDNGKWVLEPGTEDSEQGGKAPSCTPDFRGNLGSGIARSGACSEVPKGDLSQDDFQRWIDDWRHASALRVESFGKGTPLAEVRMRFREGGELALGILALEPEVVVLRPDEKLVYYLSKGAAQRLLSPPVAGK